MRNLLAVIGAGYSTRLGIPKHTIKLNNGKYLFEELIENIPSYYTVITTNRKYAPFWDDWLTQKKYKRKIQIIIEDHSTPEENKLGPLFTLTSNIVNNYKSLANDIFVSCVDSYYSNFDFVRSMSQRQNSILLEMESLEYAVKKGVAKVTFDSDRYYVEQFVEKPKDINALYGHKVSRAFIFTSLLKTTLNDLAKVGPLRTKNYGDLIPELMKYVKIEPTFFNGMYRDVGIPNVYKELIQGGMLREQ